MVSGAARWRNKGEAPPRQGRAWLGSSCIGNAAAVMQLMALALWGSVSQSREGITQGLKEIESTVLISKNYVKWLDKQIILPTLPADSSSIPVSPAERCWLEHLAPSRNAPEQCLDSVCSWTSCLGNEVQPPVAPRCCWAGAVLGRALHGCAAQHVSAGRALLGLVQRAPAVLWGLAGS